MHILLLYKLKNLLDAESKKTLHIYFKKQM